MRDCAKRNDRESVDDNMMKRWSENVMLKTYCCIYLERVLLVVDTIIKSNVDKGWCKCVWNESDYGLCRTIAVGACGACEAQEYDEKELESVRHS